MARLMNLISRDKELAHQIMLQEKERALFQLREILTPLAASLRKKGARLWQEQIFADKEDHSVPADRIEDTLIFIADEIQHNLNEDFWLDEWEDDDQELLQKRYERLKVFEYHIDRSIYDRSNEFCFGRDWEGKKLLFDDSWDAACRCQGTLSRLGQIIEDNLSDIYEREKLRDEEEDDGLVGECESN